MCSSDLLFSLKVIRYLWTDECRKKKPIIIVNYYKLCGLIGLCNMTQSTVLDIRSGEISRSGVRVFLLNALIWVESLFYKRLFIISENLRLRLKLSLRKAKLIPLGAIEIGYSDKSFKELNLLYVGTFFNREIHLTVRGLAKFKEQHPEIPIKYTIIGFGPTSETELILREIKSKEILEGIVDLYGRLNHRELKEHFKKSNIGVSFVPQTDYFHCQPPTKTFEYICSGLVCIATATDSKSVV
mgnify:FL=1